MRRMLGNCPNCGEIDLDPRDLHLLDTGSLTGERTLAFRCRRCSLPFRCTVDAPVVQALEREGVPTMPDRRATRGHPERPPGGPPLTFDDLLDFHALLESDAWFPDLSELVVRHTTPRGQ